jgi:hypothetical protein
MVLGVSLKDSEASLKFFSIHFGSSLLLHLSAANRLLVISFKNADDTSRQSGFSFFCKLIYVHCVLVISSDCISPALDAPSLHLFSPLVCDVVHFIFPV